MNLILYGEIHSGLSLPDFGPAFAEHMKAKRNPDVHASSLSAWNLLAEGLRSIGTEKLPEVAFSDSGKPYFADCNLQFSLSHSGRIAAAIISDEECGIDAELIRPEIAEKLRERVLSPEELQSGADFFEIWTKKEAAGKLTGSGISAHPRDMDLLPYAGLNWLHREIEDSSGNNYFLSAVCRDSSEIKIKDCV